MGFERIFTGEIAPATKIGIADLPFDRRQAGIADDKRLPPFEGIGGVPDGRSHRGVSGGDERARFFRIAFFSHGPRKLVMESGKKGRIGTGLQAVQPDAGRDMGADHEVDATVSDPLRCDSKSDGGIVLAEGQLGDQQEGGDKSRGSDDKSHRSQGGFVHGGR